MRGAFCPRVSLKGVWGRGAREVWEWRGRGARMAVERVCLLGVCADSFVVNVWFGGITAVAAAAAVYIAWYQLSSARHEAAIRATFDAIQYETSSKWIEVLRAVGSFAASCKNKEDFLSKMRVAQKSNSAEFQSVRELLNRREYVAILLRSGGGDLRTYRLWCGGAIHNEWTRFRDWIREVRKDGRNHEFLANFEWLAEHYASLTRTTASESARPQPTPSAPATSDSQSE
jgi:hypothetical protein